jgi:hypothetical protein
VNCSFASVGSLYYPKDGKDACEAKVTQRVSGEVEVAPPVAHAASTIEIVISSLDGKYQATHCIPVHADRDHDTVSDMLNEVQHTLLCKELFATLVAEVAQHYLQPPSLVFTRSVFQALKAGTIWVDREGVSLSSKGHAIGAKTDRLVIASLLDDEIKVGAHQVRPAVKRACLNILRVLGSSWWFSYVDNSISGR